MTDTTKPSGRSGSDDPWEQLAEDLFGLDYGKEHASAPGIPGVQEIREIQAPHPQSPVVASPPAPCTIEHETVEERGRGAEVTHSRLTTSPGDREPAADLGGPSVLPATPSPQDSYWDALANWNWGEGEGPAARSKPSESRGGEATRGGSPRSREGGRSPDRSGPASADVRAESGRNLPAESAESGDFGLGISSPTPVRGPSTPAETLKDRFPADAGAREADDDEDDEEEDDSPAADSGEPETAGPDDENAPRKRRRRRRRRRSRNGNETVGATPSVGESPAKIPGDDWDQPAPPPAALRGDDRPRRPQGEGRPQTERGDDRSRGSRDRRGPPAPVAEQRRTHPGDDFETEPLVDEVTTVGGGDTGVDFAADDESVDAGDSFVNFAEVPTWEEAISYLLHPNQVQIDTNGGSGDSRSDDQPRQTRHYGGRRH